MKVLLIEDNPGDARLIREWLAESTAAPIELELCDQLSSGLERLAAGGIDAVLLDLGLPDSQGLDTLQGTQQAVPSVPIVVLTGTDDQALAVRAVQMGAQDYLVKGRFESELLGRTLSYAVERHRLHGELECQMQALRESEERFHRLAEATSEGIVVHEGGLVLDANLQFAEMLGYDVPEMLGMDGFSFVVPERRDALRELIQSRHEGPYEAMGLRKDGSTFPMEVRARASTYAGRAVRVAAVRDLTEQKRAEEALRESEERFRTLSQAALEGILIHENGKILDANRALATMFGYEPSEAIGMSVLDFTVPESRGLLLKKIPSQHEEHYEAMAVRKDGTTLALEISSRAMSYRGRPARVVAIRDITERKRAEEALRESESKYRHIFENIQDVFYRTDTDGIITEISPSVERYGFKRDELLGTRALDVYANPQDRAVDMRALAEHGEVVDYEVRLKAPDGRVIHASDSARALRDPDGKIVGVEGILRDITGRKRAEETLQTAREELEDRVERRMQRGNVYGLTFRELTVLHLAADGKSDKEIGVQLGISPLTASKHVENILAKMGSSSRTEASVRALKEGLLH